MKHAALFFTLGTLMGMVPCLDGCGWTWIILWLAMNMLMLGVAYARCDSSVFGKQADGTLSPVRVLIFLPYLLLTWGVWRLCLWLPEPKIHHINEKLTVGRRLVGNERPTGITTVLDMTAEFAEPASVRNGVRYISLPTLDALAPSTEALRTAIHDVKPDEHVFIHCAQGHGRTGLAATALLLQRGLVKEIDDGLTMLRNVRPGIGLSRVQRACLQECLPKLRV